MWRGETCPSTLLLSCDPSYYLSNNRRRPPTQSPLHAPSFSPPSLFASPLVFTPILKVHPIATAP
ncbi:hypothetical protein K523DRAFT_323645 [Schizophyllum commune Tattone D]|nr:hypothetical protein K523DRAFT_323645 [Schizophyllum commune Tattone D]